MMRGTIFNKVITYCVGAFIILISSCVERIEFDVPPAQSQLVVEGMISDTPGPYTVKITKAMSLDQNTSAVVAVEHATITLIDDEGNEEPFTETNPGVYESGGIIQGQVGHAYHILVETEDGMIFESDPDYINPVGEIEDIRYEYEQRTAETTWGETSADVFNVYVDADAGESVENYIRWRFKGTYKVLTYPELHMTYSTVYTPYKSPLPCSGYVVVGGPIGSGGLLEKREECTCCTCWANHLELVPQLSDMQLVSDGKFKKVKVGEVPINSASFYEKYMVEVDQMSLSRKSFEFFKLIRAQKEGASSLFQPPSGEIIGNIRAINTNTPVVGLFWATSLKSESLFIYPSDIPYPLIPLEAVTESCYDFYPNASNVKPALWDE